MTKCSTTEYVIRITLALCKPSWWARNRGLCKHFTSLTLHQQSTTRDINANRPSRPVHQLWCQSEQVENSTEICCSLLSICLVRSHGGMHRYNLISTQTPLPSATAESYYWCIMNGRSAREKALLYCNVNEITGCPEWKQRSMQSLTKTKCALLSDLGAPRTTRFITAKKF
jgi:hypothetical protein